MKETKMKNKKIIIGITAEGSVNLLLGQLAFYKSKGYQTYLMAPYSERSAKFCIDEGCEHLIINIEREISISKDLKTLWQIFWIFKKVKRDIVNLGTPKVSLLGMIAAALLRVPKRIYTCRGFRFEHEAGIKRKVLIFMEKITSFRKYMDSLGRSPTGKKMHDSIVLNRPGLLDSLTIIENYYYSHLKN